MLLSLLAPGCSFGLTPSGFEDTTTTATRIDAVSPAFGAPGGGTNVEITGAGFVGDVVVSFGGVWGEATVVDSSTLTVTTPGIGVSLTVDVVVESDNGVATLPDGFAFRVGGGGDTGGDDTGGGDTTGGYDGLVGGYAEFEHLSIACLPCYGLSSSTPPTVTAGAKFHAPSAGSWLSWIPSDGACVSDAAPNTLATTTRNAGATLILNDGARDVTLTAVGGSGGVVYEGSGLVASDYTFGGVWDLAGRGGADVGALLLNDTLRTPADFSSVTPAAILATSTGEAFTVGFGSSAGTPVTWSPSGVGDLVLVTLEASSGGSYIGSTTCRSTDDGSILIPGSATSGWDSGTQLSVRIVRYDNEESVLTDGSTFETSGRVERVGTGVVRY